MRQILEKYCTDDGLELIIGDKSGDQQLILLLNYHDINLFLQIHYLQQALMRSNFLENPTIKSDESFVARIQDKEKKVFTCCTSSSIHIESGNAIFTLDISGTPIAFVVFSEDFQEIYDYYCTVPRESSASQLLNGIYWRDYTSS